MRKLLTCLILTLVSGALFSQANLKKLVFSEPVCNIKGGIVISYDPSTSNVINKECNELPKDHPFYSNGEWAREVLVMKTKIDDNDYFVVYTSGPSCDIGFFVFSAVSKKQIGAVWGEEIVINGSRNIYTLGHNNQMFVKRRKYELTDDTIRVVQPEFYYVGIKSRTINPIVIYTSEAMTDVLASLPAGYEIDILVAKEIIVSSRNQTGYLVKTPLGLVGWALLKAGQSPIDVEGLYFEGD